MQNRPMRLILRWRLTLNQRRIQSPDEYLRGSFFVKAFKGWLIITLPCEKMPAQIQVSQHLLVQIKNRKRRKIYESCSKLTIKIPARRQWCRSFLTLNSFYKLFRCLLCWLWTSKFHLGQSCNFIKNILRQSS